MYLVLCADGKLYCGASTDPHRRLRQHNGELAGDCSSDLVYLLGRKLEAAGQGHAGLMIMEGFRNNRRKFMQDFMG